MILKILAFVIFALMIRNLLKSWIFIKTIQQKDAASKATRATKRKNESKDIIDAEYEVLD